MEDGRVEKRHNHSLHALLVSLHSMTITPQCFLHWRSTLPCNINHRRQGCSVAIPNKNDHLDTVNMSDCVRPWCKLPSMNKEHMLAVFSYWPSRITSSRTSWKYLFVIWKEMWQMEPHIVLFCTKGLLLATAPKHNPGADKTTSTNCPTL